MVARPWSITVWVWFLSLVSNGYSSDAVNSKVAVCEQESLTLGFDVAAHFKTPTEDHDWSAPSPHDHEKLVFAPWMVSNEDNERWPRSFMMGKWIYILGDSTVRQIWGTMAAPVHGGSFEKNAKEWTRQSCTHQSHRTLHPPNSDFPSEGWQGSCGVNEVTCHIKGYGATGKLSFDWKHFPYEDYDEYLFSAQGPFLSGFPEEGDRLPDAIVVQVGLHTCWHAVPEGYNSKHLTGTNSSMIAAHIAQISQLMQALRTVADHAPQLTVLVMTSGLSGMGAHGQGTDACIRSMNQAAVTAARQYNFPVLDRAEIEQRLLDNPAFAKRQAVLGDIHLPHPAPNLIATCLLHLLACLGKGVPV